jgi:hypothetical protein
VSGQNSERISAVFGEKKSDSTSVFAFWANFSETVHAGRRSADCFRIFLERAAVD